MFEGTYRYKIGKKVSPKKFDEDRIPQIGEIIAFIVDDVELCFVVEHIIYDLVTNEYTILMNKVGNSIDSYIASKNY